jgi:hypothetical protein
MSKRTFIVIVVAAATAAVAVSGAGAGTAVPFKGTDTASGTVVGGSGSVIQTADAGVGNATHLGRFTLVAGETVDLAAGLVTDGHFTLTAVNGDTVTGTYSGHMLLTGYLVSGPITGGTGRFAGASGFLTWHGTFDLATFTGSDVISGTISAVGSI